MNTPTRRRHGDTRELRVLGVMTGTSCDGLDAACVEIDRDGWHTLWSGSTDFPRALRRRVLEIQRVKSDRRLETALELNRDLGDWYGDSIAKLLARRRRGAERPHVIANHGQTIAHFPAHHRKGVTLQLGDPARVAYATGLTVVSHFRDGDMAAGGEGAPLAPLFHRLIAEKLDPHGQGLAIHNLGGISNLTYLGPKSLTLAFDTGPGNIWIDAAAEIATHGKRKFDRDGRIGAASAPDETAVRKLLKHPYFRKALPKSTGRDDFPVATLLAATKSRGAELVATATWVTLVSVVSAYQRFILNRGLPLRRILLCGGGAKNLALLEGLRTFLPEVRVDRVEDAGLDGQTIEAQAFAIFGYLSLAGIPVGGKWTGAKGFAPPGQITPGENWSIVLETIERLTSRD